MQQTIYETISEVFETMFFTFLEPCSEIPSKDEWTSETTYIKASIKCTGGKEQSFRFYFPEDLARHITVNFIGAEQEELDEVKILDTMRETANMAIGNLLGRTDPEGSCSLGIPATETLTDFSPESLVDTPGLCVFRTDSGLLWLTFEPSDA